LGEPPADLGLEVAAMRRHALLALFALLLAAPACRGAARGAERDAAAGLTSPPGFEVSIFADRVPGARSMVRSPAGVVYVGTRGEGEVYALPDADGDGRADRVVRIASGLAMPNGIALRDGALYVVTNPRVLRFDAIDTHLDAPPKPAVVRADLPTEQAHGWRYAGFGPDGLLYVSIGSPCNVCDRTKEDPRFGTIVRMRPDGSDFQIFARGIRNSVGFTWRPGTGVLWFTDNGRDWLGDDAPPDELDRAPRAGLDFGFPFCHGGFLLDPKLGKGRSCAEFVPPAAKLPAHVAALGVRFYQGSAFPAEYRGQAFIAEHGSWNRRVPDGYRVVRVRLEGERAVDVQPFVEGFRRGGKVYGRPVDLLELPDGSLLVSDDYGGRIYRVVWRGTGS
jgi:glucose/arabinose dehydrogenase